MKSHNNDFHFVAPTTDQKIQLEVIDAIDPLLQFDKQTDSRTSAKKDAGSGQKDSGHPLPAKLPDVIANLYTADLQVDGCSTIAQEIDDLDAILDLNNTDREVDGVKG